MLARRGTENDQCSGARPTTIRAAAFAVLRNGSSRRSGRFVGMPSFYPDSAESGGACQHRSLAETCVASHSERLADFSVWILLKRSAVLPPASWAAWTRRRALWIAL